MWNRDFEEQDRQNEIGEFRTKFVKGLNKGTAILFNIALGEDSSYDSEYDGVNDSYCRYCDANLSHNDHLSDCDIFEAREAISKIWERYNAGVAEINKKHDDRIAEKRAKEAHRREKIECSNCGKKVTRQGMKEHKKSSSCRLRAASNRLKAHEERTGLVCYSDPWMNYDGKRCKQCTKPMPDAHPNAIFCSNKGKGNCKDKHHNKQPGRIERTRKHVAMNQKPRKLSTEEYAMMITAAWREGNEGWDGHKDY